MLTRTLSIVAFLLLFAGAAQARDYGGDSIECRSPSYQRAECAVDFRQPRLLQQLSTSDCIEGRTWGYNERRGTIWVTEGCAGVFVEGYRGRREHDDDERYGRDDQDERQGDYRDEDRSEQRDDDRYAHRRHREEVIECRSSGYAFTRCGAIWREARLLDQLSNSACVEGDSWGIDDDGLWVDKGCAGRFAGH